MAKVEVITSLTNPRVKRVVRLRKPRERRAAGVLIAEGRREVGRALAAGLELRELYWCAGLMEEDAGEGEVVCEVSEAVLRKMAYHEKPEGVLAVFGVPAWGLDDVHVGADGLVLVVVGTEKPGNLGAMLRTAAAAGCAGVLAVGPAVDVFNPNVIRNSTGAVFALPTVVVETAAEAIAWLRKKNITILAAIPPPEVTLAPPEEETVLGVGGGGVSCFEAAWSFPAAVVVGPEHAGLDAAWQAAADVAVSIPMARSGSTPAPGSAPPNVPSALGISGNLAVLLPGVPGVGGVDSLNASNAAAVLLYEAVRRRGREQVQVNSDQ